MREWEKRALLAITVIPDVLCTHMINPFIDQSLWPNAPLRHCQSRRVPAYGPSEMSSTHTPLLSSARWLSEWLTDSLTHTNSWRLCLPTGVQYYQSTHAPLLIFRNRAPSLYLFFCITFYPVPGCKLTLCHNCQCSVNWKNLPAINIFLLATFDSVSKY